MNLTEQLFEIANIGAEWVLWLLLILSVVSIAVIIDRAVFLLKRRQSAANMRHRLTELLNERRFDAAQKEFETISTMEGRVLTAGLARYHLGIDSVNELMTGEMVGQKARYERRLPFLATLGSNAPFIGLFGTVLGIIQAFARFDINGGPEASAGIMAAISEALVATGVGLMVAIPAVIAFNCFSSQVKKSAADTEQLVRIFLGFLAAKPAGEEK